MWGPTRRRGPIPSVFQTFTKCLGCRRRRSEKFERVEGKPGPHATSRISAYSHEDILSRQRLRRLIFTLRQLQYSILNLGDDLKSERL